MTEDNLKMQIKGRRRKTRSFTVGDMQSVIVVEIRGGAEGVELAMLGDRRSWEILPKAQHLASRCLFDSPCGESEGAL